MKVTCYLGALLGVLPLLGYPAHPSLSVCHRSMLSRDSLEKDTLLHLNEVIIRSPSMKELLESTPFSVNVIPFKNRYHQAGDLGNVLNRTAGVRLRTDGGIGASTQINLGGLQGKAVKLFKDGIPLELFGHGFDLGMVPVNMLERVEIYKGSMPVSVAADALGGGINLVTRDPKKNFAEVAYELASFGTHRATTHVFYVPTKHPSTYIGLSGSFNTSANNYRVNAPFYDRETGERHFRRVRRFHDGVSSLYSSIYGGLRNLPWADNLQFTLIHSNFRKEIQHDAEMNRVYGEALSKEKNHTALFNYRKGSDRFDIGLVAAYSHFRTRFIDTTTARYDWNGELLPQRMAPGEINKGHNQRIRYQFASLRLNTSYRLNDRHTFEFSELFHRQHRVGTDPLGAVSVVENVDVLTVPAIYRKNTLAASWRSKWVPPGLESLAGIKYYDYKLEGFTTDNYQFAWRSAVKGGRWGYMAGLKWSLEHYLLKVAYELATRIPDEYEVFGDGVMVKENLDLRPERSHNLNIHGQYSQVLETQSFSFSVNLFYRRVKEIIFLQLDIPFNRYINYEEAEIKGIEIESTYTPARMVTAGVNATYQDIRRVRIIEPMFRNLEGARVPNIPYLFGNFFVQMNGKSPFHHAHRLTVEWNTNYVHRFFLKAIPRDQEPRLFEKVTSFQTSLVIPRDGRYGQFTHDASINYLLTNRRFTLSAECKNLANTSLYDNFNVQKPGRSFHLKLVYQFL